MLELNLVGSYKMNVHIDKQMCLARNILRWLRKKIDEEAIIAGGAPRDWTLNSCAKDIDIYYRSHLRKGNMIDIIREFPCAIIKDYPFNYNFGFIDFIINCEFNDLKFQFIKIKENTLLPCEFIINNFDFDICRVWDNGYAIHETQEFKNDISKKLLTLRPDRICGEQLKHSLINHYPRLQDKFPDHQFRVVAG